MDTRWHLMILAFVLSVCLVSGKIRCYETRGIKKGNVRTGISTQKCFVCRIILNSCGMFRSCWRHEHLPLGLTIHDDVVYYNCDEELCNWAIPLLLLLHTDRQFADRNSVFVNKSYGENYLPN